MIKLKKVQVTYTHAINAKTELNRNVKQQVRKEGKDKTSLSFDLQIATGKKLSIIGASGAGKSTLLNIIAGFVGVDQGEVWLDGINHTRSPPNARPVSMLFQKNNLFSHLSVADNIGIGIKPNLKLTVDDRESIIQVADQVGLTDMLTRKPEQLSGGQQQRVALARCLLRDRPILLLDEPFSALDKRLRMEMMALLLTFCERKNLTLLLVTHQPDEVEAVMDEVISL